MLKIGRDGAQLVVGDAGSKMWGLVEGCMVWSSLSGGDTLVQLGEGKMTDP